MALRLAEVEPREYTYLITPTGDELPELLEHWARLEQLLGKPLERVTNQTLAFWIQHFQALPNHRQRWCTRLLKIEPTLAFLARHAPAINYVGLRADEPHREGIYGDAQCRFPLREWGWRKAEVIAYLDARGVAIPERTDCARCYGQRLIEWKRLLRKHPTIYASAIADEEMTGRTFRSAKRDTWPAGLKQLASEFESGRAVRGEDAPEAPCRVCSL